MDNKITLPKFATLLALKSGMSKRRCEDFLREFFILISRTLETGEQVKVNGLGVFKLLQVEPRKSVDVSTGEDIEIPGHVKVVFTPSKDLAEAVNAPFEMFEAVEVFNLDDKTIDEVNDEVQPASNDIVSTPEPEQNQQIEETIPESDIQIEPEPNDEKEPESDNQPEESFSEPKPTVEKIEDVEKEDEVEEPNLVKENPVSENRIEPVEQPEVNVEISAPEVRKSRFGLGFVWGFVAGVAVLAIGLFVGYKIIEYKLTQEHKDAIVKNQAIKELPVDTEIDSTDSEPQAPTVEVADKDGEPTAEINEPTADTQVSDSPKYDVISKTRYLTTMSKEYYGTYHFWPYIYEENKDILGHPDRIRPGTKVRIPSLAKYGVDPRNPADVKRAKEKGAEIYARYNKK